MDDIKNASVFVDMPVFARLCYKLLNSDRDVVVGVAGFTGEGKTRFTDCLLREYARISKTYWDFDRMTWSRSELMEWINGKEKSDINLHTGLKENQLPEYSCLCPDELFFMFYKRTWFDQEQIDAVSTFNTCRDRHLLICGNVPDFWDLDAGFLKRVRFYVYIPERGTAWVFQQENNPFNKDPWNVAENKKLFRKRNKPFRLPNFVCEIKYNDWTPDEKQRYYNIRNKKRLLALSESRKKRERYADIKDQRNNAMRCWVEERKVLSKLTKTKDYKKIVHLYKKVPSDMIIGDKVNMSHDLVRLILRGN